MTDIDPAAYRAAAAALAEACAVPDGREQWHTIWKIVSNAYEAAGSQHKLRTLLASVMEMTAGAPGIDVWRVNTQAVRLVLLVEAAVVEARQAITDDMKIPARGELLRRAVTGTVVHWQGEQAG